MNKGSEAPRYHIKPITCDSEFALAARITRSLLPPVPHELMHELLLDKGTGERDLGRLKRGEGWRGWKMGKGRKGDGREWIVNNQRHIYEKILQLVIKVQSRFT